MVVLDKNWFGSLLMLTTDWRIVELFVSEAHKGEGSMAEHERFLFLSSAQNHRHSELEPHGKTEIRLTTRSTHPTSIRPFHPTGGCASPTASHSHRFALYASAQEFCGTLALLTKVTPPKTDCMI